MIKNDSMSKYSLTFVAIIAVVSIIFMYMISENNNSFGNLFAVSGDLAGKAIDDVCSAQNYNSCNSDKTMACINNKCVQKTCADTDKGNDYFTKGTVKSELGANKQEKTDYCIDQMNFRLGKKVATSKYVVEHFCNAVSILSRGIKECAAGTSCSDGACVNDLVEISTQKEQITVVSSESAATSSSQQTVIKSEPIKAVSQQVTFKLQPSLLPSQIGFIYIDKRCVSESDSVKQSLKGTVTTDSGETNTDYCKNFGSNEKVATSQYVQEYMCINGKTATGTNFCLAGTVCSDGACVSNIAATDSSQTAAAVQECADSNCLTSICKDTEGTAFGTIDQNVKGTVTLTEGTMIKTYIDECNLNSPAYLKDYYCTNENVQENPYRFNIRSTAIDCGYGYVFSYNGKGQVLAGNNEKRVCFEGTCVFEKSCTDDNTDADAYHKGTVTEIVMGKKIFKTDFCVDTKSLNAQKVETSQYVAELSCDGNVNSPTRYKAKIATVIECSTGTSCVDGVCV